MSNAFNKPRGILPRPPVCRTIYPPPPELPEVGQVTVENRNSSPDWSFDFIQTVPLYQLQPNGIYTADGVDNNGLGWRATFTLDVDPDLTNVSVTFDASDTGENPWVGFPFESFNGPPFNSGMWLITSTNTLYDAGAGIELY